MPKFDGVAHYHYSLSLFKVPDDILKAVSYSTQNSPNHYNH
jgi:hypothetical protein